MTYQTILLHLDNEAQAPALVKLASTIASQYEAHLIGLFVIHPFQLYLGRSAGAAIATEVASLMATEQIERMKKLHEVFDSETKNQNYIAEWRFIDERIETVTDILLQEATTADLLIIGQQKGNNGTQEIINSAMLASPVPVLVVPSDMDTTSFGQNVLVAWDGGAQSARAVVGANTVLKNAQNVLLHHVRTSVAKDVVMESNMHKLAAKMSRHNIKAEISESVSEKKEIGNTISGVIRDHSIDCVVMGAYGHSTIRNLLLGSTTDYALKNMTVPLLMWH